MSVYDFIMRDAQGNDVNLADYKGKVLLIVNTATGCGFTPQYEGLEELYEKYNEKGFEILDFPCNQFAGQAPGTDEEIVSECKMRFNVSFKQFSKIEVNGDNAAPLYKYLKEEQKGAMGSRIKWNFTKFLVSRDGQVVARFSPIVTPEKMEEDIVKLL